MPFIRKKLVEMDGASVLIGSLTGLQVEEFLAKQTEAKTKFKDDPTALSEAFVLSWKEFIATSLNNANPDRQPPFSADKLHHEFDSIFIKRLQDEVMALNSIEGKPVGEEKAP